MLEERSTTALIDRPAHFTGAYEDYTTEDIEWVARQFNISGAIHVAPFPGRGNINLHTYEVLAGGHEYLLQKVNADVFTMPYRVMRSMITCIDAQRTALDSGYPAEGWEPIELIPTRQGRDYLDLTDEHGWSVWRLMVRIPDSICYKSLAEVASRKGQLDLAEEAGRGLAVYTDLTSSISHETVEGSLPGYRDTGLYYRLFHSVMAENRTLGDAEALLPQDPIVRASVEKHFLVSLTSKEFRKRVEDPELQPYLEIVREHETFAMVLWSAIAQGRIRPTLIHGDPKVENFLFSPTTGKVKSLVDLDTIMSFTWLNDFGDMIRSMVNVAGEKERDLDKVRIDYDVFDAVARGFLTAAKGVTEAELALMVPAIQVSILELGVRFLTDYLRGDTYFQLGPNDPPDLNKVRAIAQLHLYRQFVEFGLEAEQRLRAIKSLTPVAPPL
jgi:hypothetical protein